jgi:hypothetical protein
LPVVDFEEHLKAGWAADFRWNILIRPRLEGLTDAEYLWAPAPGALTIRPAGDGEYTLDPVPGPEPTLGNIAWRMAHLSYALSSHPVAAVAFGPDWPAPDLARPAGTAGEGMDRLDRSWAHWLEAVAALPEGDFARPLGPAAGQYAQNLVVDILLHIYYETLQRGADLCLLRDLYYQLNRA